MPPGWTPAGVVAVILAACLGIGWATAFVAATVADVQISREGLQVLAGLGQTLAGAVATWLGFHVRQKREDGP